MQVLVSTDKESQLDTASVAENTFWLTSLETREVERRLIHCCSRERGDIELNRGFRSGSLRVHAFFNVFALKDASNEARSTC